MKRHQSFKFQLITGVGIERNLRSFSGACRFVYNKALSIQNEAYSSGRKYTSYNKMASWLKEWKSNPETEWLNDAPSQALQQSLIDLDKAHKNFFEGRSLPPKFKKRGSHDSFRVPQKFKIDQENNRISLPKLGWIRYRGSRKVTGEVKNVTVSQTCGKWYVCIQTEVEVEINPHPSRSMVGLDVGVARLVTLSDGTFYSPVNSYKSRMKNLARLQKTLSRKVKFSSNWRKQKRKIQRLHFKIFNIRNDYLNKITTTISKNHAMIVIEDLNVKNMSKSSSCSKSNPGRNINAKSGLNRSILDQGWGELRRKLEYKQAWLGGNLLAIPPAYTSQRRACCGYTSKDNRISQSKFMCKECGYEENADTNGARNILAAGHAVLSCGETVL